MSFASALRLLIGLVIASCAISTPASAGCVAVTFDDLPTYGEGQSIKEDTQLTIRLLAGLRRHHIPATGFVNERQLEGPDRGARINLLERWLDAGMDLGNHGFSHLSLSHTPLDTYIADTERGALVTSRLLAARGRTELWFRYPFLETGPTLEVQHAFEAWLTTHGYRVAPVTMENADWRFADAYNEALAIGDPKRALWIKSAYIDYSAKAIAWYRKASVKLQDREIRFVLLLHASKLNADSIDELARILRRSHLRAVTLNHALKDPAYGLPETISDPDGDDWLTRWSTTLHHELPFDDFPEVPANIASKD